MEKQFSKELDLICSDLVRSLVEAALRNVNDKFYHNGASSTGKYHPDYAAGDGGLFRHTKSVVYFVSIFCNSLAISQYEKDCLIASAILHDTCKLGLNWDADHTVHEHPVLVYQLLDVNKMNQAQARAWKDINNLIATHMGEWTTSSHSDYILPSISIKAQVVLHWGDYLGSRKAINVNHYGFTYASPEWPTWEGKNSEIFKAELDLIKNNDMKDLVKKALDKELYSNLTKISCVGNVPEYYKTEGGLINKMKTSIFIANQLLGLKETFLDEEEKDLIYASIFFKELNEAFSSNELEGVEIIYWSEIMGMILNTRYTWEGMLLDVCEKIALDSTLEISVFAKEDKKEFVPATERQIYRLNILLEKIKETENYDGKYDNVKPDKLSKGMAGKYISELKPIVG